MIKADKLTYKYFEEKIVLKGIDLTVNKGEFVAILGHNGSGKSTLAKHFNAILLPSGGSVMVDGIDTALVDRVFDVRQRVGMVFQNPDNQMVATVVEDDVAFAPENLGVEPKEIRERVDSALKAVGMYELRHKAPHMLSGGQKQRVAIAGIIAMKPNYIVLDEPTAMLDPNGRREVIDTIRLLNKNSGITIILITHYMDEAAKADRVVVMDDGNIIIEGAPKDIFSQVARLKKIGLDVPQTTELMYELNNFGMALSQRVLTVEECVSELVGGLK